MFKYASIHEYLNEVLPQKKNLNNNDIVKAKKEYWRLYHKYYNKERRKKYKEFTIGISLATLEKINTQRGKLSVTKHIKNILLKSLNENCSVPDNDFEQVQQKIMSLIFQIDEYLDNRHIESLENIRDSLENIELYLAERK